MLVQALLGIIQGIFEWLPISSEGVVALVSNFLVEEINPIEMALGLHLGTLIAVLIYFRRDWTQVLTLNNKKLLRFLAVATFVSLIVGYPVYKLITNAAVGSTLLLMTGLGLLVTAYFHKQRTKLKLSSDNLALIVGFLQGLAVVPGFSRSASTIFGLSLSKSAPQEILKVSYMMSAPVVLASSGYVFINNPSLAAHQGIGLGFSFLVGLVSLSFLLRFAQRINFYKFALFFALLCFLGAVVSFISSL